MQLTEDEEEAVSKSILDYGIEDGVRFTTRMARDGQERVPYTAKLPREGQERVVGQAIAYMAVIASRKEPCLALGKKFYRCMSTFSNISFIFAASGFNEVTPLNGFVSLGEIANGGYNVAADIIKIMFPKQADAVLPVEAMVGMIRFHSADEIRYFEDSTVESAEILAVALGNMERFKHAFCEFIRSLPELKIRKLLF